MPDLDALSREVERLTAQLEAALNWYYPTADAQILETRLKEMRALKLERDTAAARYFAAVGE